MQNNDCIHNFSNWKKGKEPVLECESMDENSPVFMGIESTRRCKTCGLVETKIDRIDKKENKKLSLNMKRRR